MGDNGKQSFRLGFLTAIEVPEKGFVGGLLVTNHYGRPLEFQCTLPVKPNPTQEILYGPALGPFVLGELIGGTLIEKAGIKPHLILTDQEQILEVRNTCDAPVAFVSMPPSKSNSKKDEVAEGAADSTEAPLQSLHKAREKEGASERSEEANGKPTEMRLGKHIIRFHAAHADDRNVVKSESQQLPTDADLREPFDRVREALQETIRSGALR